MLSSLIDFQLVVEVLKNSKNREGHAEWHHGSSKQTPPAITNSNYISKYTENTKFIFIPHPHEELSS